jgi:O-antigen/teichoic acid export membrane protein
MDEQTAARGHDRDRAIRRGGLATIGARAIMALISVAILAIASRSLTHEEFGLVATLTSLYIVVGYAGLGLGGVLMTRLAAAHGKDDRPAMRQVTTDAFTALGMIGAGLGALGALSVFVLPWPNWLGTHHVPDSEVKLSVALFFVFSGISVVTIVGSSVFVAMQRLATDQIWTAVGGVVSLVLAIIAAVLDLPPWGYVVALTAGPGFTAAGRATWALVVEYPYMRPRGLSRFDRRLLEFAKSSGYLGLINIAAAISLSLDAVVVAAVKGASAAAVFSVASRMFLLLGTVVGLVGRQVWAALTEAINRGDFAWARSRYARAIFVVGGVVAIGSVPLVVLGKPLARIWVGSGLVPPTSLFITLFAYTVYITCISQASVLLLATQRLKVLAIVGMLQTPLNLAISILFTHWWGLVGPVIGRLVSHIAIVFPVIYVLTRRVLNGLEDTVPPPSTVGMQAP